MKILVVEDEAMVSNFIREILTHEGHVVVVAENGIAGLGAILNNVSFDRILTDVLMPKLNGLEFYQRLIANGDPHAERLIFMSGYISSELGETVRATGRPLLPKPFKIAELLEAIEKV